MFLHGEQCKSKTSNSVYALKEEKPTSACLIKCTFFVLSARNILNPDSGGPRRNSNPSSTIAFNAPPELDRFSPRKLVDMVVCSMKCIIYIASILFGCIICDNMISIDRWYYYVLFLACSVC